MALQLFDRVQVTATANTTVSFTLGSAVLGYRDFSVLTNGDTTYYGASDGTNWEVGIGTYSTTGPTLTRTTILSSSNSGSATTFSGTVSVWIDYPAGKSVYKDASGYVSGYTIENSPIGATTASTGKFTSVTTPSVTATTTDLTLSAISTGAINFATAGGTQFKSIDATSSVNVWNVRGGDGSTTSPRFTTEGTGTNIAGQFNTKGTGALQFFSGNTEQMRVTNTASAVNYVQVTGAATNGLPTISAQGSDSSVALAIASKSTSPIVFQNGAASRQFRIDGTVAAINYLGVAGSTTGNAPILSAASQSSDTNVALALQSKGTGAIDLAAGSSGVNISNGGTVTAITRTAGGTLYTTPPAIAITAPTTAGGVQATATCTLGLISSSTIGSGGTGYTVGDTLTLVGGTSTVTAQITVSTVSAGVITGFTIATAGTYTAAPTNPASLSGGTGSGATLNTNFTVNTTFTITNAGSGYIEQPTVSFSGGGGSGAAAYATVGSDTVVRTLGNNMLFYTPNQQIAFRVTDNSGTSGSGYWSAFGGSTSPILRAIATANARIEASGAVPISFYTNSGTSNAQQMAISHTASAVNYVQVTGAATTGRPIISAQGSDTNISLGYDAKGTGGHNFKAGGNTQVLINNTASAVNSLNFTGSATNTAPVISVTGTDTNIDLALTPKGTGIVRANGAGLSAENGLVINKQTVATNATIATGYSAMSAGPVTVASGVTVTVASGSRWVVI